MRFGRRQPEVAGGDPGPLELEYRTTHTLFRGCKVPPRVEEPVVVELLPQVVDWLGGSAVTRQDGRRPRFGERLSAGGPQRKGPCPTLADAPGQVAGPRRWMAAQLSP